jgi:CelD/BcsL family acetyltransferase involved in cellulose biosynthesis
MGVSIFLAPASGKLAASAMAGLNRTKRLVKHNPALLDITQNLRSMFR